MKRGRKRHYGGALCLRLSGESELFVRRLAREHKCSMQQVVRMAVLKLQRDLEPPDDREEEAWGVQ